MKRKGLEPIIAVIVLVVFTIALAAIIVNWTNTFAGEKKEKTDIQFRQIELCAGTALDIAEVFADNSGNIYRADVHNPGSAITTMKEIRVVGENSFCIANITKTLSSGEFMSISLEGCSVTCTDYQSTTIQTACIPLRAGHVRAEGVEGCSF